MMLGGESPLLGLGDVNDTHGMAPGWPLQLAKSSGGGIAVERGAEVWNGARASVEGCGIFDGSQ